MRFEQGDQSVEEVKAGIAELSTATQDRLTAAANDALAPQLIRPFSTAPEDELSLFSYRSRTTPMLGREKAMYSLAKFIVDPKPALWTLISGPAGSGKSRVAAELIAMILAPICDSEGIPLSPARAGFLKNPSWIKDAGLRWRADTDTLLVIDYASEFDLNDLRKFLANIDERCDQTDFFFRLILIDRLPPDSDMGLVTRLVAGTDRRGEILAHRWHSLPKVETDNKDEVSGKVSSGRPGSQEYGKESKDPLSLEPLAEPRAMEIAQAWAPKKWTAAAQERLQEAFTRDRELARPLFAALLGHGIRNGELPPGELNPVTVASTALAHQFRNFETREFGQHAKRLLAVATAGQGVSEDDLLDDPDTICGVTGEPVWHEQRLEALRSEVRRLCGTAPGKLIPPLIPDFLGGLFVLEHLLRVPRKRRASKADELMSIAWKCGKSPGQFLVRLAADFLGDLSR
jgi:hypothetical protein